jgi:hypothetical protein
VLRNVLKDSCEIILSVEEMNSEMGLIEYEVKKIIKNVSNKYKN